MNMDIKNTSELTKIAQLMGLSVSKTKMILIGKFEEIDNPFTDAYYSFGSNIVEVISENLGKSKKDTLKLITKHRGLDNLIDKLEVIYADENRCTECGSEMEFNQSYSTDYLESEGYKCNLCN